MAKVEARRALPPYIPFKTFQGFIEKLKDTAVPERVDTSLLKSYSGSIGRQIVAALKFLKLLDDNNFATQELPRIVKAYGTPEWQDTFADILGMSYSEVLSDLNLDVATFGQLQDRFKAWGAEGQVLQKCISFYLAATINVGWTISPHVANRERTRSDRTTRTRSKRGLPGVSEGRDSDPISENTSGSVKFLFPIPDKTTASISLPSDLATEDWVMIDTMIRAYIARKDKKQE
jgi:hypothetical protein